MQNNKEKNIIEKFTAQGSDLSRGIALTISIGLAAYIFSLPSVAFVEIAKKYGLVFTIVICFVLTYGPKLLWK